MAGKVNISAQQWSQRWKNGMQNASTKMQEGVNAVTEAPGIKAAAASALWLANVTKAEAKFARNVAAVSLDSWKNAYIKKGIPGIANAAQVAEPKVQAAATKLIPAINNLLATLPPRTATLDGNLQRVRHMAAGLQEAFS